MTPDMTQVCPSMFCPKYTNRGMFINFMLECWSWRDGMIGLQECSGGPPVSVGAPPLAASSAPPTQPSTPSRARDRAALAVDYYNTRVSRAWAARDTARSSFNDRHRHHHHLVRTGQIGGQGRQLAPSDYLCRSNSSLELLDHHSSGRTTSSDSPTLRREYGSHGSIDVIDRPTVGGASGTCNAGNEFFKMLQDYRPAGLVGGDQRSPGPAEYLRVSAGGGDDAHDGGERATHSPKFKDKLKRHFWANANGSIPNGATPASNGTSKNQRQQQLTNHQSGAATMDDSCTGTVNTLAAAEAEEIARRRAFAHYDCQSLTTNLNFAVRLRRNLLAKRRNTATGASAASMLIRSSTPEGATSNGGLLSGEDDDPGDGRQNELVASCPFFRNEIGGEEERAVSLSRLQPTGAARGASAPLHRPPLAYGVAVLEFPPGETHWRHSTCPYQRFPRPIENVDRGALYYRKYFMGQDHQNWFGMDEQLGPVVISIRREKVVHPENQMTTTLMQFQYRLVIRTSELQTLRGAVLEDAVPNIKPSTNPKSMHSKEVLEYVAPEVQLSCLRLGVHNQQTTDLILKLDEQGLTNHYKVGIMYCKAGQNTEEEMYNNEEAGPAFTEFLETIGKKVRLHGFDKYRAGLDNKTDSTGLYSVYAQYQDCEIMFHVSTMLPFTPNNRQQLLRKRHIGNDIVTIVFQEPGALPFTPKGIRSQFQHVFIVVNAINPCTENTHYKVAVSRSKDVEVFGPPIKEGAIFPKGKVFAEFLLAKVVNAENAAHRSEKFVTMATRTRQEYLKDLVMNYSTSTPLDTGQKFSIFGSKKKDKPRPRFIPDLCQRGAILWQVLLDDSGQGRQVECFLGVSSDTFVLIEEQSRQIVFVTPCKSILGWSPQTNSLRVYHHQGECMTIHMRDWHVDRDELMEIMDRLKAVTGGHVAQEFTISRNIMGQLGFHVQPDGIVTLVESAGQAWQAGLRQNSRLVEICKVAVATLTYDQMVDLLKTSITVTLTVIPPLPDGSPRKGCTLQNCKYNEPHYEGDYENTNSEEAKGRRPPQGQPAVSGNHRKFYERSFSPPRSSNSSGYGTGSSSKSFRGQEAQLHTNVEGTLTSSSSGHSDDKWYDRLQELDPPPVPVKSQHASRNLHANNTFPSTPKRNNYHVSQIQSNHSHYGVGHGKIHVSNSLPLQHVNVSQPLVAAIHNNMNDLDLGYKLEKNNIVKQHNERLRQDAEYTSPTRDYNTITANLSRFNLGDGHSSDSSLGDRLNLVGSEEELIIGSGAANGSGSPRVARRPAKQLNATPQTPAYYGRNQSSPRSMNGGAAAAEAKLRPGVTSRSSNRNSANLSTNFQEELMRLINPDNIEPEQQRSVKEMKTHSRENLNNGLSLHKTQSDMLLGVSRSTSNSASPLHSDFKRSQDDVTSHMSPSKVKLGITFPEDFPLPEDSDWPSLVDTATSFMNQVESTVEHTNENDTRRWNEEPPIDASITSSVGSSTSVPELQNHVAELESKVDRETRRRMSLENEVRRLTEENRKLQDQAHAAATQLRRFTEWFFKNVKRQ